MSAAHLKVSEREAAIAGSLVGGRYRLIRPLAVGGMAEVFLARLECQGGLHKDVVIKRLRPELASDERVASMFEDESRISGLLGHANTVHAFDQGVHEELPFIAMEYIRGEELNHLCRRGISCGTFLPLEHAIELVRQAALGMGHYHNLRDEEGKHLELVHCDISPNNLLVNEDGYVQIIDFGIGQFADQRYRDDQLAPGKLSYMSPEQALRRPLDHRSDIFSLGIILYEITLGRRLFRGAASEVLPRIQNCEIQAPTFVNHDYPGAFESIVMRALEAEPADRFQEAYDFADALGNYLREEKMRTGAIGIARYIDRLRVEEGGERREEFIPEAELAEDELDFDRGLFSGFEAMVADTPEAAASWDEVEEDESAVADALGINVDLVRAASRAPSQQSGSEGPHTAQSSDRDRFARGGDPAGDTKASAPDEIEDKAELTSPSEASRDSSHTAHKPSAKAPPASSRPHPIAMLALGVVAGVAGAFVFGALG